MEDKTPILEFDAVTLKSVSSQITALSSVDLVVRGGELAWVDLEEGREHTPLGSLAQGLVMPDQGRVLFRGEDWMEMGPSRVAAQRGRIRRVFEHYGWVTNLDVMENICLAECYHTGRPLDEIVQDIRDLARRFGIDCIPEARPTRVHGALLRKLEWVRAFVGKPDLIILERPLFGVMKADAPRLMDAVCEAIHQGVAVLWMADDPQVLECRHWDKVFHYRMNGERLEAV